MNSHVRLKPVPAHWCLQAALIRRGGNRKSFALIPVQEIDGVIRQLRDQSLAEEANRRVSGDGNRASSACNELCMLVPSNPVIPNAPEGFGEIDSTQSETRERRLYYDTDGRGEVREPDGTAIFDDGVGSRREGA